MHTDRHGSRKHASGGDYVDTTVRVRYAETDRMGVAYYANHFVWFELGRTELFRRRGYAYRQLEQQEGCTIVVAEAHCRYHAPVGYDDVLTIRTRSRAVQFSYEVLGEDGSLVATGETLHVITDRDGRPRSLPEQYRKLLEGRGSKVSG